MMKMIASPVQRALLRVIREIIDRDAAMRGLLGSKDRQLPGMIVEQIESDDWASLTFVGEVHRIGARLTAGGAVAAAVRARLDQLLVAAEIALPGAIVAEIAVTEAVADGNGMTFAIEALTLHD